MDIDIGWAGSTLNPPPPQSKIRVFCIPFAGGAAAAFRPWTTANLARIEIVPVEIPGRGRRRREASPASIAEAGAALADELTGVQESPFVIFGHSMGALIAFETVVALERRCACPLGVVLSAATPLPVKLRLDTLGDDELIARLKRWGGTPDEVLANRELVAMFLPQLRHDLSMVGRWRAPADVRLRSRAHLIAGDADRSAPPDQVLRWRELFQGKPTIDVLRGGHFYFTPSPAQMLQRLEAVVERWTTPG